MFSEEEVRHFMDRLAEQWCNEHNTKGRMLQLDEFDRWILLSEDENGNFVSVNLGHAAAIEKMMVERNESP